MRSFLVALLALGATRAFLVDRHAFQIARFDSVILSAHSDESDDKGTSLSFDDTDAASKGFVSSLTNFVNAVMDSPTIDTNTLSDQDDAIRKNAMENAPTSPTELRDRIRDDYVERNYLWTGNIDLACFAPDCQFQDPTLSFTGRDQFVTNVQNLQPILEAVQIANPQSILLDIQQTEHFVQTRWNMVGSFGGWLFWKPQLNVIGNTKFWFRPSDERPDKQDQPLQVYFYEEEWEMPAYKALLQLLRPGQKDTASG